MAFSVGAYSLQLEKNFGKPKMIIAEEMLKNCKVYLNSDFYNIILFFMKYNKINYRVSQNN